MADQFTINLQEEYQKAFGVRRPIFTVPSSEQDTPMDSFDANAGEPAAPSIQFEALPALPLESSSVKSPLGTPVLTPIRFKGGAYKERLADGRIITTSYEAYELPHSATLEVTLTKRIVRSPRYGGSGDFKEKIGQGDPKVMIRGFLFQLDRQLPEQHIRRLKALEQVPHELEVVCNYLSWLSIHHLCIESIRFPQAKTTPYMIPFEMVCWGDQPISLTVKK